MAIILGTIESLKSLKSELESNGITRFNSVKEIKEFLSNYDSEKSSIMDNISEQLALEYSEANTDLQRCIQKKAEIIKLETEKLDKRIFHLENTVSINNVHSNFLKKCISWIRYTIRKLQLQYIVNNKNRLINQSVRKISKRIENNEKFIEEYHAKSQELIEKRAKTEIEKLKFTRKIIENSKNLIAGAIGENLVAKEIEKLSDDFVLINDYKQTFYPPIYSIKYKERIYSIQIDHLLISKAGIFIIETKNWSKNSVNSTNLRSPIRQIKRSSFALYKYISENITLFDHHWGEQQVPIRNIVVMINNKPSSKFKFVSIKLISELNNYLKHFEPVLNESQFKKLVDELT